MDNILVVILVLVIIGFVMWLVNQKVPMDDTYKMIMNFVVIILVIIWLLNVFGIMNVGSMRLRGN